MRAVVFDIGGVLVDWSPRYLYQKLISDPARLDWFLTNVLTLDWHFKHDAGALFSDTSPPLIEQFPEYADLIKVYGPRWLETIAGPIPGVWELVDQLANNQIPLFAITNFSAEFYPSFAESTPVIRHFQDVVVSGEERLVKPDPQIYALARQRFGLEAGDALFIDDRLENVQAAAKEGFVPHHFTNAASLEKVLAAGGFL